jgi:hypothetical protein
MASRFDIRSTRSNAFQPRRQLGERRPYAMTEIFFAQLSCDCGQNSRCLSRLLLLELAKSAWQQQALRSAASNIS